MIFRKIGLYFILFGGGLVGLFLISDMAATPEYKLLLSGALLMVLGIYFFSRNKPDKKDSQRFRLVRSLGRKKEDDSQIFQDNNSRKW
ncbi:MAG: hypothetical protein JXA19_03890 [Anaerolineales bacterium]|nr:hypothetical protein [Anaerolineales bacterium]